jgi:hypothetical protein
MPREQLLCRACALARVAGVVVAARTYSRHARARGFQNISCYSRKPRAAGRLYFRLITVISICTYDTCICRKCMCVVVRGDYTHALHVVCACCDVSWIDQSRNVFMHVSTQTWTCNATGRTCNALRLACIALIIHTRCMLHCTCMQRV